MIVVVIGAVVLLFVYSAVGTFRGVFVFGKRFQASWRREGREVEVEGELKDMRCLRQSGEGGEGGEARIRRRKAKEGEGS